MCPPEDSKRPDVEMKDEKVNENADNKQENKEKNEKDKKKEKKDELTAEDRQLKENLELLVTVVTEAADPSKSAAEAAQIKSNALESLRKEIKSSTSSMTSIPKPLKFLKPHFDTLKNYHSGLAQADGNKQFLADILSVLAMTLPLERELKDRECLKYKLLGVPGQDIGAWGHEYVRNLSGEIGREFQQRQTDSKQLPYDDLDGLIDQIVPFFMNHNAEFDAVDMLIEVEALDKLKKYLNSANSHCHARVCAYMLKCAEMIVDEEEQRGYLQIVYEVELESQAFCDALRVAIRLGDSDRMTAVMQAAEKADPLMLKQLAFILASNRIVLESYRDNDSVMEIMGNGNLSSLFQQLASDLDVKEAKSPEDIYKSHLEEGGGGRRGVPRAGVTANTGVDSAKQNLASSFVNSFVNCAFGKDLLITPEGSDWLYKNKSHGMLSATASLGMLLLWDVESGFSSVDKYSFSNQAHIKAGAALAQGILSTGVTSDMDAAQALLSEHVESKDVDMKLSAIFGLGLAYCGSARSDVLELLVPLIVDESQSMEVIAHACLALGLVYCGTASEDISGSIIEAFLDRSETDLKDSTARLMCLGLGLVFLNRGGDVEAALIAISAVNPVIQKYLEQTVTTCAYAGIASPLEVQKYLNLLTEHIEEDEKDPMKGAYQEIAVLGIAMCAIGEELSQEMALRALDHVLQCCEVNVRRVVPLALGFLSMSNPRLTVSDTLSKLSHDQDERVSQNAVLALGLIGAGTNNSRLANILRSLAAYYSKEPNHLFLVRIAQGLLHLGKGLMTISPLQSEGFLVNRPALAGLLTMIHASIDMKNTILGKRHYLLYSIVTAIRPRMLMTLDENLKPISIQVRLGQKVDVVGAAGKPKTITGFQTHKTPVLISAGERAELATEEYIALNSMLEGFVIVKKNPNYKPPS